MSNWAKFAKFGPPLVTFTSTKSTAKQSFLIPARWLFLGHRSTAWGKSEIQVWWKFHLLGLLSSTVELHFAEKSFFEVVDLLRSWFKPPLRFYGVVVPSLVPRRLFNVVVMDIRDRLADGGRRSGAPASPSTDCRRSSDSWTNLSCVRQVQEASCVIALAHGQTRDVLWFARHARGQNCGS